MSDPRHYSDDALLKIPLVNFKGTLISKSADDVCFEIEIQGNHFRKFFPLTMIWLNDGSIDVHEWLARRMGLLGSSHETKK